ncbi:MAG: spermidine/putrescine ABC transporter substrate-binding protein [Mycobacterium sp.]
MPPTHRRRPNRRQFLHGTALLAGAPAIAVLLDACSKGEGPDWPSDLKIATPEKPVTWDIPADNRPIPDGLAPEKDATLRIFTYDDYISREAVESFEKRYGPRVEVSTFNGTDDALDKIRDGADFDIYTPSYDQIGRLVTGGLLRPLNHSYFPNIKNVWPAFHNPWYDGEWRYSVPYTVYSTGIGWRTDQITADIGALANPYDALWDPAHRDQTAIIDDVHTAMSMVLLKLGITDVNTSSPENLDKVAAALDQMRKNTAPAITVTMFTELPAGLIGLAQMWSDDMISAKNFLPEGVSPDILRYWFPADGKGLVDNDMLVVLRGGKNPVAAQLFMNHMLDPQVAKENFAAAGSLSPQVSLNPDYLVSSGLIPANLKSAIVRPEYFDVGYRMLELEPANEDAWRRIWKAFKTKRP